MAKQSIASFVLCLALVLSVCATTNAKQYVVGDALGWAFNVLDQNYLANWLIGKTFYVGDELVFNCAIGTTLVELTKEVFESGLATPYIRKYIDGPSTNFVILDKSGNRYFSTADTSIIKLSLTISVNV